MPLMRCLPTGMTALADPAIVCRVRRPTRPRSLTCRSGAARDRRRSHEEALPHPRRPAGRPPHAQPSWPTSGSGSSYSLLLFLLWLCYLPGTRRAPARPSCCTARRASRLRSSRCALLYVHRHTPTRIECRTPCTRPACPHVHVPTGCRGSTLPRSSRRSSNTHPPRVEGAVLAAARSLGSGHRGRLVAWVLGYLDAGLPGGLVAWLLVCVAWWHSGMCRGCHLARHHIAPYRAASPVTGARGYGGRGRR